LDPGKRWVTLTGEKWNPDRAVLALSNSQETGDLLDLCLSRMRTVVCRTVACMASPTGTTWNPLIAQLTAFETLKNAHF